MRLRWDPTVCGEVIQEGVPDVRDSGGWARCWHLDDGAIWVVDKITSIDGPDPVKVEVERDLGEFCVGQALEVLERSHETVFFRGPEREAYGIGERVLAEVACQFQEADCSRAVVIDALNNSRLSI